MPALRFPRYLLVAAVTLLLAGAAAQARDRLVMASTMDREHTVTGRWLYLVYQDAFRQMDLDLDYRYLPPLRGTAMSGAGTIDGEIGRGYEYGEVHPELVRVPEAPTTLTMAAFAVDPEIRVQGWDDLKKKAYRIGYHAGFYYLKLRLEALAPPQQLDMAIDSKLGLMKLAVGHTDVYVDIYDNSAPLLAAGKYRDAGLHLAGVLEKPLMFAYFNKKHAQLAPRLSAILKEMKAKGTIERYRAEAAAALGVGPGAE